MTEMWEYRTEVWTTPDTTRRGRTTLHDLSGFDVEAIDGHIGKVDADTATATGTTGNGCLVVDTGFWIFGKKRMIPAGVVQRIDDEARKIYIGLTKDEVKNAPDYDEVRASDDTYRSQVGDYYRPWV